jgi:serine/threonine-protein kinase
MRPQVGLIVNNKYRLLRLIGDGGMGSVYEARHELLGTTVALKFLHPELSRRSGLVQRFLQEARVSAQIQSPHVVRVIDVDQQAGGLAYIVMEYLEGKTLQTLYEDLYRAGQRLSYADAIEYAMQIIEGVEAAHMAGIVHRDLKPDNVIISRNKKGEPLLKLLDFGIAKLKVTGQLDRGLTRPGVVMGTPEYMAPEQAYSADAVDARADIFSLGVMVFEMLAGRRPVGGDDPHQIATSYMTGQISRLTDLAPHIAPDLAAVIHRAMAPTPNDRFGSVAEFRSALEPFALKLKGVSPTAAATPVHSGSTPSPAASPAPAATPAGASGNGAVSGPGTSDPGNAPIPKTIAPDDAPGGAQRTSMSEPPSIEAVAIPAGGMDGPKGTPLGGFDAPADRASTPLPGAGGGASGEVVAGLPATVDAAPFMADANAQTAMAGALPATVDAAPFMAGANPATKTDPGDASFTPPERAGGTAVGAGVSPFGATEPVYPLTPQQMGVRPGDGTMPMDPIAGPTVGVPDAGKKRAGSGGPSVLSILLIATSITGMVLGGVYLVQEYSKRQQNVDDGGQVATQPPPTATLPSDPGPTTPPPEAAAPSYTPPPPPPITPAKPTTTAKPPPTTQGSPTSQPTSTPTGTAASTSTIPPPVIPSTFPPVVIPSTFPGFPTIPRPTLPGGSSGGNTGGNTSGGTTTGGSQPAPTGTTTGRPKIPRPKF